MGSCIGQRGVAICPPLSIEASGGSQKLKCSECFILWYTNTFTPIHQIIIKDENVILASERLISLVKIIPTTPNINTGHAGR